MKALKQTQTAITVEYEDIIEAVKVHINKKKGISIPNNAEISIISSEGEDIKLQLNFTIKEEI